MEQEEEMRKTLQAINDSLTEGRFTMESLSKSLESLSKSHEATTALAMGTDRKVDGYVKLFQGISLLLGAVLAILCWVLLQKNDEIKDLHKIAIAVQQEAAAERVKRDMQMEAITKEFSRQSTYDVRTMETLFKSMETLLKSRR